MARFRATIHGNRGVASRLGTPKSGLTVTVNGWNCGVVVEACVDSKGRDQFAVYKTGGSSGRSGKLHLADVTDT